MKLLCIGMILVLSGCATQASFKRNADSWLGMSEHQLTASWGIPARVYTNGDRKLLEYSSSSNMYMPGSQTYTTNYYGNSSYTTVNNNPGYNIPLNCVITFQVYNGFIESYNFRGNNCVAK